MTYELEEYVNGSGVNADGEDLLDVLDSRYEERTLIQSGTARSLHEDDFHERDFDWWEKYEEPLRGHSCNNSACCPECFDWEEEEDLDLDF